MTGARFTSFVRMTLGKHEVLEIAFQGECTMICVTIGCGSHKRMLEEWKNLAEDNVKFVELRLDYLRKDFLDYCRIVQQLS